MAFFNYVTKEITLKVVYYGPGLSGKTTNLQYLYSLLDPSSKGKFISLSTDSDRTLFFDFLPVELGRIKDFAVRFQLYTVPGQIRYNATRKLVLKGADAVVFVADSQRELKEQNLESFEDMRENLLANNLDPDDIPVVMQYNKRDLPDIFSVEELNNDLNKNKCPVIEASAVDGKGVEETFRLITRMLLKDISKKHKVEAMKAKENLPDKNVISDEATPITQKGLDADKEALLPRPDAAAGALTGKTPDHMEIVLHEIKQSIIGIQETLSFLSMDLKESRRQQADILKMLDELSNSLSHADEKKRWFHLGPK